MKMRTKIIVASCVTIVAIVAIVLLIMSEKKGPTLICNYPSLYKNYTEELKFEFRGTAIEKFYRTEVFTETDKSKLDEEEQYFKTAKEKYKEDLDTFIKYDLKRSEDKLTITTYVYVPRRTDFFDNYMASKEIHYYMTIDKLKASLEEENYSCQIKK